MNTDTAAPQVVDVDNLERQREWSLATFGPGLRTNTITAHIQAELGEIETVPLGVEEWCDVVVLALDGAWRAAEQQGMPVQQVIDTLIARLHRDNGPTCTIDTDGTKRWRLPNGQLHRLDGPAVEYPNGTKAWYRDGELHRLDGPAVEHPNGYKEWYRNDKLHRLDGPAVEWPNGYKEWYRNGELHRDDGPAIEYADGGKEWWRNDKLHRDDGPAREWPDGDKFWYQDGKRHRLDGPAVEWAGGGKFWYRDGERWWPDKA